MLTDGLAQRRLQISGWLIGEDRDTPYDGSGETSNPLQERTRVRVYLITGDLRIGDLFGVQISSSIPDITRSAIVSRPSSTQHFSENFSGLGDTSVIAWKRLVTSTGWNITMNAGASLPTGRTERPRFQSELDEGSLVPVSRLQRGTGTVDPLVGITLNRVVERILPPGVRLFVTAAARVPIAENEHGLRTGASWETGAGVSRELGLHELVGIARVSWLHRQQDVFNGTRVLVGGGDWLTIAPAIAWSIGDWTLQGEVKVPLYRSLANRQLDSPFVFQVGVVWTH